MTAVTNPSRRIGFLICILYLFNLLSVHGQLPTSEQEALLDLVRTFDSVPYDWDTNDASNACNWNQIRCNTARTSITQINVNSLALGGYFSPSIGNLTNIEYLALSNVGLTGTIPDELILLPNLQYLLLERNLLNINLSRFADMPAIKQLYLGGNTIYGTIPDFSEGLEALSVFDSKNLSGTIPPSLFQQSSIIQIFIGGTSNLIGTIPPMDMPNLKILSLNILYRINGTIPSFDNVPSLEELYLANLRSLTGLMPNMTTLFHLRILSINVVNIQRCFEVHTAALTSCSVTNTLLCSDCKPWSNCTVTGNPTNCNPIISSPTAIAPDGTVIIPSPTPVNSNDGLSQEAVIAIAVVIPVVVAGLAVFLIIFLVRRNKKKKKNLDQTKSELPEWLKTKKTTNPNFELLEREVMKLPQKLFTPYEQITVKNLLGVGSFGQVFVGEWQKSQVALKISLSQVSDAFIEEIKLVSEMRPHPNIVQLLGYSIHPDNLNMILIMEFCNGGSLDTHLFDSNADIPVAQKLELVKGIALGLNHLHANGIIHRDIAARNILLANGVPKLSDFGMSRQLDGGKKRGTTKADTGPVRWMAPESLKDQSYSPQSDVWMFGVLMFEVFARSEPHANEDPLEVGIKIRNDGYTPQVPSDVPLEVTDIMKRCWNVDPEQRPTMAEVVTLIKNLEQ